MAISTLLSNWEEPDYRWKNTNSLHEMYCAGHLIEAGLAHRTATGSPFLFDVGRRFGDHILSLFGPGKRETYPGHQELELAFAALSKATDNSDYAELAQWMILTRGSRPSPYEAEINDPEVKRLASAAADLYFKNGQYEGGYSQDHKPLIESDRAVGHAVRAMYYYCGAVDCCYGSPGVSSALDSIWENLISKQMYITGGIGSSGSNEGFTVDYDLPNLNAYAETCAGIGLVFWAWRMHLATGKAVYIDVLERALYNAVLSGISLSTDHYFYDNPLESRGANVRQAWFSCACCPPNLARLLFSVQQYAISLRGEAAYLNIPLAGVYKVGGGDLKITSRYPWRGDFSLRFNGAGSLIVKVRKPEWCVGG